MKTNVGPNPLDRARYPIDPWRLVETSYSPDDLGLTETIFSVANGYLGMRGTPEEGRPTYAHGTFINGFHETWPIRHAENAYGFAKTGQTIVNAPDAKIMKIYVDDEPLTFGTSDLEEYERVLDFREGMLRRHLVWRTPSGKRVAIKTTRMVSMTQRHLAIQTLEITMLSGSAPIVVSSQLLNRQDGKDEYHVPSAALGEGMDPRRSTSFDTRVLIPQLSAADEEQMTLGYRCANSGMTIAVSAAHQIDTPDPIETIVRAEDDLAKTVFRVDATEGSTLRLQKTVAYHTSRGVPVRELAERCERTLDRAIRLGVSHFERDQRTWYDEFWSAADVEISAARAEDDEDIAAAQQATRFNLFSLAQATARTDGLGVPAKGVTGSGYEGHYFWDTECYVIPFLCYTQPEVARNVMHARSVMLPAARQRALEMAAKGALFAWRTINGQEASAYYAAGTAQVHIDADIAFALMKYVYATGDTGYLIREGVDILVETSRMWADLGFWRHNGEPSFHIHGVTGPDEYTTVVNNNLFTNVMARYNLEKAVETIEMLRTEYPREHAQVMGRLDVSPEEVEEWARCAAAMHIPYDEGLGIHPQDDNFLDREVWDLPNTPDEVRPLLLHYHPLVIYRFQVLKQTDVVLALFQQGNRFTPAEKRADFEYYDPITTGDSSLSAVVQSIMAAEVGYQEDALRYFYDSLYVDLHNMHGNTVDGMHIASTGGVWGGLAFGFGGMRDYDGKLSFDPRLPAEWGSLVFRVQWHSTRMQVALARDQIVFTVVDTPGEEFDIPISVRGEEFVVSKGAPVVVPLADQGPRIGTHLDEEPPGGVRSDGSKITATVPTPIPPEVYEQEHIEQIEHAVVPSDGSRGSERLAEEANKAVNLSNISQTDSAQ